jgi:hypothetical protein
MKFHKKSFLISILLMFPFPGESQENKSQTSLNNLLIATLPFASYPMGRDKQEAPEDKKSNSFKTYRQCMTLKLNQKKDLGQKEREAWIEAQSECLK